MTTAATFTDRGVRVTDDLVRLVRNPPPGTAVIYMDRNDGELRAFTSRDADGQTYFRVWPSNNRYDVSTRSYGDVSWDNTHGHTTNVEELRQTWVEIPLDLAPEETPGPMVTETMRAMVTKLPDGFTCVALDPNDGEMRAFADRDATGYVTFNRVWCSADSSTAEKYFNYTGRNWIYESSPNISFKTAVEIGWKEIPVGAETPDVAGVPEATSLSNSIREAIAQWNVAMARRDAAVRGLDSFRDEVVEVATKFANENDNRGSVQEVLNELGLDIGDEGGCDFAADITINIRITAHRIGESYPPDEGWVQSSMNGEHAIEQAIRRNLELDDDCEDFSIDDISFEVTNVEEN